MSLYREEIIERWRYPRHRGVMPSPDAQGERVNAFCGDEITLFLRLGPVRSQTPEASAIPSKTEWTSNGVDPQRKLITEARFMGEGCALATASADILCEAIEGSAIDMARQFSAEDLLRLYGEPPTPGRLSCVLLCHEAFHRALAALF